MKMFILQLFGWVCDFFVKAYAQYKTYSTAKQYKWGKSSYVAYPHIIRGGNNIELGEHVSVGPGATLFSTGAKLVFRNHIIAGPNLTAISGDHKYVVGEYIDVVKASEKESYYDQDIIVEEDVWIGANVILLKGVTIGRSSIVAAGSVVTKNVPPFSIVGGVPAKVIKKKWEDQDIQKHISFLDNEE